MTAKAVPPIITKARAKFKRTSEFATAMKIGATTASSLTTGNYKASEAMLTRAHEIVNGSLLKEAAGTLIVLALPNGFETLYDVGQAMGGTWRVKRKLGKFWVGVINLPTAQALTMFKRVGKPYAKDIIAV